MKTPVEMQLKIIDKMRENVEGGLNVNDSIQIRIAKTWIDSGIGRSIDFEFYELRIKPETITINGVEIPKPLCHGDIVSDLCYYHVENSRYMAGYDIGNKIKTRGIGFAYKTKEEAIEASKALFGITG